MSTVDVLRGPAPAGRHPTLDKPEATFRSAAVLKHAMHDRTGTEQLSVPWPQHGDPRGEHFLRHVDSPRNEISVSC